jgi:hypothetical protein
VSTGIQIRGNGTLPETYQAARSAIAACAKVDECKSWADRAEAIASYARQADDETLLKHATRIKVRAIKRCGELLRQFEAKKGKRAAGGPLSPRDGAAKGAGLSTRQRKQAQRVAAYAKAHPEEFETAVEGASPPTVTELAKRGTKKKKRKPIVSLGKRTPDEFYAATKLSGGVSGIYDYVKTGEDLKTAVRGLTTKERKRMKPKAVQSVTFLKTLIKELG